MRPGVASETTTVTANARGIVQAAGWAEQRARPAGSAAQHGDDDRAGGEDAADDQPRGRARRC